MKRDKGIKEDVWIPAYCMQGLARINVEFYCGRVGPKMADRTKVSAGIKYGVHGINLGINLRY